jgi:Protein of unknown function (DUF2924)
MGPGCTGLQPETAASPALAAPSASRPERLVPRIRIGPALPDRKSLDPEIARLRDLGVNELRSRWHTVFGREPPPHLPRHLLFRVLAYQLQADQLGDLDGESQRLLDRSGSPENLAVVKGMAVQNGGLWVQSPELELRDFPGDTPNRLRNARAKELSES